MTLPNVTSGNTDNTGLSPQTLTAGTPFTQGNTVFFCLSLFTGATNPMFSISIGGVPAVLDIATSNFAALGDVAYIYRASGVPQGRTDVVVTGLATAFFCWAIVEMYPVFRGDQRKADDVETVSTNPTISTVSETAQDVEFVLAGWANNTDATGSSPPTGWTQTYNAGGGEGGGGAYVMTTQKGIVTATFPHASISWACVIATYILAGPTINVQPLPVALNVGDVATFTVKATANNGALSYQWQRNGSDIVGATSASYTTPAVGQYDAPGVSYRVVVTDSNGSTISNPCLVTVIPTLSLYLDRAGATQWQPRLGHGPSDPLEFFQMDRAGPTYVDLVLPPVTATPAAIGENLFFGSGTMQ